jgi:predicted site-specific integrase-resolvase
MRTKVDIEAEVAALGDLSREELAFRWERIYKCPPPPGVRRELLIRAVAWHLQAKHLGGFSTETRRLLRSAIDRVEKKFANRDSQANDLPDEGKTTTGPKQRHQILPGARLLRDWNGKTHVVDVIETGFVFEAKVYPSLSAIARKITGALVRSEVLRAMSNNITSRLRCAVYTRKSSEEGLDQEFNSLDAQREACVAFIASQVGLGWKLIPDRYDDGGISGGTLERPAIQRLLQDIRDKKVDVVVVYKIDRLTRSLMDFSKIVATFDANSVSFVDDCRLLANRRGSANRAAVEKVRTGLCGPVWDDSFVRPGPPRC